MVDVFSPEFINSLNLNISFNLSLLFSNDNDSNVTRWDENSTTVVPYDKKHDMELFNYYLMGIGGTCVCCIGIICNILSVIVLTRRVMNSSTYSYLSALALCDTLALFFTLILYSEDLKYPVKGELRWAEPVYVYLFPFVHPAAIVFQVTSIWLTLAFTVDRYIMICHPFKAEKMCTVSRARKVIVCLYIFGIIFNIPRFLEYRTGETLVPTLDNRVESRPVVKYTSLGLNKLFLDLVHSYFYLIFVCGIPFVTLSILNSFLIYAVHLSRKKGRQINAKERKRNDTTVMLIGVVVIFLICQGPALIARMVYAIDFNYATTSVTFHIINELGNFLVIINSAINIVPYYFFGKRFRKEFWRLFCFCCMTRNELRKMKHNLSFSMDNKRRVSQCSALSAVEMNGYGRRLSRQSYVSQASGEMQNGGAPHHKDSCLPLMDNIQAPDHRDSLLSQTTNQTSDGVSPVSDKTEGHSLRVVWEMDNNKNEKYSISVEATSLTDSEKIEL